MTLHPVDLPVTIARARWPEDADPERPPPVPGFVATRLIPLVIRVAERCLTRAYSNDPSTVARALRTGVVLASKSGDVDNARATARAVDGNKRVSPLLFFQSVPNAALGHIAVTWGLGGPLVSVCPAGDAREEAIDIATSIIRSGDADDMLALHAEQELDDEGDTATAFLVTLPSNGQETTS